MSLTAGFGASAARSARGDDHGDAAVGLLAAVEESDDGLDDPARVLVIVEGDRPVVEPRVGVRGRVLARRDAVVGEVLVGDAVLVHVALPPQRVHARRGVQEAGRLGTGAARHHPRVRLAEALLTPFVEGAVDQHVGRGTRDDRRGGELNHRGRGHAAADSSTFPGDLGNAERVAQSDLLVLVASEGDHAVDVGRRQTGVADGRQRSFGRQLDDWPARVLGELGLADAADRRAIPQHFSWLLEPGGRNRVEVGPDDRLGLHLFVDGMEGHPLVAVFGVLVEARLDGHAVAHVAHFDVFEARHHADALFEIDEHHDGSLALGHAEHPVHRRHPGVDHALAGALDPVAVERVAVRTDRPRRLHQRLAVDTALDDDLAFLQRVDLRLIDAPACAHESKSHLFGPQTLWGSDISPSTPASMYLSISLSL